MASNKSDTLDKFDLMIANSVKILKTNILAKDKTLKHYSTILNKLLWLQRRIEIISKGCALLCKADRLFELGNDLPNNKLTFAELKKTAEQYLLSLRRLDSRVWAFRKAANNFSSSFYLGSAENIGYRRTKRGETERPNDLFAAYLSGDLSKKSEGTARVLDLELCDKSWHIRQDKKSPTTLSKQLRDVLSWD